jgi:S1-C subfamily serine protease
MFQPIIRALTAPLLLLLFFGSNFAQTTLDTVTTTKKLMPSVVSLQGVTSTGTAQGSGFIVSADGKIATNLHVIRDWKSGVVQLAWRTCWAAGNRSARPSRSRKHSRSVVGLSAATASEKSDSLSVKPASRAAVIKSM